MRKLSFVLMALLVLLPVAAFARGGEETAEPEAAMIDVFGVFRDQEALRFEEGMVPFEERTGIDMVYQPSSEFETQIFVRIEAGNPPDIAAVPQPGLMRNFAERGALIPLPGDVIDRIDANYTQAWKDLGSYEARCTACSTG